MRKQPASPSPAQHINMTWYFVTSPCHLPANPDAPKEQARVLWHFETECVGFRFPWVTISPLPFYPSWVRLELCIDASSVSILPLNGSIWEPEGTSQASSLTPSVTHGEKTAGEDTAAVGQEPEWSGQVSPALSLGFSSAQLPSLAVEWQLHSSLVTFHSPGDLG